MLYICIPAYNEAQTVGVLLWRIRKVFQEYSREYEILVYDDGSTDATAETLAPYRDVLPLTVLGGPEHLGYDRALDALCRAVSARTKYPRRDAMITLQADFTDQPEHLPELIKRFEGGADLVVAERTVSPTTPAPVRRLRWIASWAMRASGRGARRRRSVRRAASLSHLADSRSDQGVRRRSDRERRRLGGEPRPACAAPRRSRAAWRPSRSIRATTSASAKRASVRGPTGSRCFVPAARRDRRRSAREHRRGRRRRDDPMIRVCGARGRDVALSRMPARAQDTPTQTHAAREASRSASASASSTTSDSASSTSASATWKCCRWTPCAATTRGTRCSTPAADIPFYRVNDRYEAWFDAHSLASLRYWQDIDEGSYEPKRHYEIFPDRREYIENEQGAAAERRASARRRIVPLLPPHAAAARRNGHDASTTTSRPMRNPVRLKVLRADTIEVPAGKFAAIVVQPIFESKLFSEGGHAEVWLSDDENRIMLQMKSKLSFGSLNLYLKSYRRLRRRARPLNRVPKPARTDAARGGSLRRFAPFPSRGGRTR